MFVEGVILGINSFDQWGVELGKELALALQPILEGKEGTEGKDGSTAALVAYLKRLNPFILAQISHEGVTGSATWLEIPRSSSSSAHARSR